MNANLGLSWLLFSLLLAILGCRKDDANCPEPPVAETDERDLFVGSYYVYDTVGNYLYSMNIMKFGTGGRDSLFIQNYADTFDLKVLHERYWTNRYLGVSFFPAIDQAAHRWALFGAAGYDGSNVLSNDTIPLKFTMDNIAFYWQEGVPYFSCVCKQVAVKQ